jgi:WD40 repeat protein
MKSATLCLVLSVLFLSASAMAADQTLQVRPGLNGDLEVRSVSSAADPAVWPVPEASPLPSPGREGQILWYDTNHMNAVAENVAVSGDGSRAIAGWWLNSKRVAFYDVEQGNVPVWTSPMTAAFQIPVDMSLEGTYMTATGRGDPLYVFEPSGPPALYTDAYTPPLLGYKCSISETGGTYAAGGGDPAGTAGEVRVYDGTGALRFVKGLPAPPEGLMVSADGEVVAANTRAFVKVWSATTGALRDSIGIPSETQACAVLSGDGEFLVTGGFSRTVRLYQWNGAEYAPAWTYLIPSTTWITGLAISSDGSTLVAGTWTNANGGRVVAFSTASATPLWTDASFGDEVHSVAVSGDGSVIAAASYGRSGGTVGNVISVYNRSSSTPIFGVADDAIPNIGSCMAIDVSDDGSHVFAGGKRGHAREFGYGGWTMAIQLVDPAAIGETTPRFAPALSAWPNPFHGQVTVDFRDSDVPGPRQLLVFQPDGRLANRLAIGSGRGSAVWNGCDQNGRPLPAGAYLVKSLGARSGREDALLIIKTR